MNVVLPAHRACIPQALRGVVDGANDVALGFLDRFRGAELAQILGAVHGAGPSPEILRGDVGAREDLLRALSATRQHSWLERFDEKVRDSAVVIPVAWVVDARLVSSRLDGWREDILGDVDYASVRSRASTRRP